MISRSGSSIAEQRPSGPGEETSSAIHPCGVAGPVYVVNVYRLGGSGPIAALIVTLVLLGSGCEATGSIPAVPAANPTASPTGSAENRSGRAERDRVSASLDPVAPSTYQPMIRQGRKPGPKIEAEPGRLARAATVKYGDGVLLRFDRLVHAVEQGEGPGAFPGREQTAFILSVLNRSSFPVDMTQVVVTATYGSPARVAPAVYDGPAVHDFGTRVPPGGSASATYAFAIPRDQLGEVTLTVDFDDRHGAAGFTGVAR